MAFLGRPQLGLNTPSRPAPTSPGTVQLDYRIPLFIDLLERCFIKNCQDAGQAPIFELTAEVWSTDRGEVKPTFPLGPDSKLIDLFFHNNSSNTRFRKVFGDEITNASPVQFDPTRFLITIDDSMTVPENSLNEDWGPFPPPGHAPLRATRDEVFMRVYLSSLFTAWQPIQTIDSNVETGQFFGP